MFLYAFIFVVSAGLGFVCSRIISPVIYGLHALFVAPFVGKKLKKNGDYKTVEAELDYDSLRPYDNGHEGYNAVYTFVVDGKKYSKVITRERFSYFQSTETFYYYKDPEKAVWNRDMLGRLENMKTVKKYIWICFTAIIFICLVILWLTQK